MHMRPCILFICLLLASIFAERRILRNLNDLRNVNYGKHSPRHGLKLLFFLIQRIASVDQNNVFQVNFQPNRGDYGFHRFQNYEHILPPLNYLYYGYYSVGNINSPRATELPAFVTWDYYHSNYPENNMDRLVVAVMQNNPTRINRVFLTSHTYAQPTFDPYDTYEIDPGFIQQIRRPSNISLTDYNNYLFNTLSHNIEITDVLRYTFDDALRIFHRPGLAAFLTLVEYDVFYSFRNSIYCYGTPNFSRIKLSYQPWQFDEFKDLKLEVRTTTKGYAKLIWENIPVTLRDSYAIQVAVCNAKQSQCYVKTVKELSSFSDTSIALNPGLQPQLIFPCTSCNKITFYGPVFDEANRVIPTTINEYASLQLYTEDGWACARIYIKKTFSSWKDVFYNSWVGFYRSTEVSNNKYNTYQYVVKFKQMNNGQGGDDFDIYQYESNMYIAPGVQIRFLLDKTYNSMMAKTPSWEETPSTSQ